MITSNRKQIGTLNHSLTKQNQEQSKRLKDGEVKELESSEMKLDETGDWSVVN